MKELFTNIKIKYLESKRKELGNLNFELLNYKPKKE